MKPNNAPQSTGAPAPVDPSHVLQLCKYAKKKKATKTNGKLLSARQRWFPSESKSNPTLAYPIQSGSVSLSSSVPKHPCTFPRVAYVSHAT